MAGEENYQVLIRDDFFLEFNKEYVSIPPFNFIFHHAQKIVSNTDITLGQIYRGMCLLFLKQYHLTDKKLETIIKKYGFDKEPPKKRTILATRAFLAESLKRFLMILSKRYKEKELDVLELLDGLFIFLTLSEKEFYMYIDKCNADINKFSSYLISKKEGFNINAFLLRNHMFKLMVLGLEDFDRCLIKRGDKKHE